MLPVVEYLAVTEAVDGLRGDGASSGKAGDWGHRRLQAVHTGHQEAGIARPQLEELDGVRNGRRIVAGEDGEIDRCHGGTCQCKRVRRGDSAGQFDIDLIQPRPARRQAREEHGGGLIVHRHAGFGDRLKQIARLADGPKPVAQRVAVRLPVVATKMPGVTGAKLACMPTGAERGTLIETSTH